MFENVIQSIYNSEIHTLCKCQDFRPVLFSELRGNSQFWGGFSTDRYVFIESRKIENYLFKVQFKINKIK